MSILFNDDSSQSLTKVSNPPVTAMPLTVACWFKSNDDTLRQGLISIYLNASNYYLLEIRGNQGGDPVYATIVDGSGGSGAITTTGYTANQWHHACAVFASTTSRDVYIDGGSKGSNGTTRSPLTPTIFGIGRIITTNYMSGLIAEVGIWDVELSANEIFMLSKGVSPLRVRGQNLKGYWPLYSANRLIDYTRNGNTLTALNSPVTYAHPPVMSSFGFDYEWAGLVRSGFQIPIFMHQRIIQGMS